MKKKSAKRIFNLIWKIIYYFIIIICILLILVIFMQRATNNNKAVGGLRLFRVISGSMVPQYDVGQVVICKNVDVLELKEGDTIVYIGNTGEYNGKIIMHNIVSIRTDENGKMIITTQGIYNTVGDPEITEEQIYGKVIAKARILTILDDLSNNIYTFFVIIIVLVLNVFISWRKPFDEKEVLEDENKESKLEKVENDFKFEELDIDSDEDDYKKEPIDINGIKKNENKEENNKNIKDGGKK